MSDCPGVVSLSVGLDANLAVSGGRGARALADWNANKQLTLPDWRGYALGALDDMGNTAAGRLSATYFGASPIVLGAFGGGESATLTAAQIPSITSGVNVSSVSVSGTISGTYGCGYFRYRLRLRGGYWRWLAASSQRWRVCSCSGQRNRFGFGHVEQHQWAGPPHHRPAQTLHHLYETLSASCIM